MKLTQDELKEHIYYNPETGEFFRKRTGFRVYKTPKLITYKARGHIQVMVNYRIYKASRLAFLYMTGKMPKEEVDHINGQPSDNRWRNLREATRQQNTFNRGVSSRNRLGLKGVSKSKDCESYTARICINGKIKCLGSFDTPEAAHAAYCKASVELHGEFSRVA